MSVKIIGVSPKTPAYRHGIVPGDVLISINNKEIFDVLDYRFYQTNSRITLVIESSSGSKREIDIKKGEYEEIGLEFESYLMDSQKRCKNKCVFCFIDQLPKGMRESLYFKDDDSRLSFLFGNYITLTNLCPREVSRIIDMHISPVNISVHTTNPDLRSTIMGNRFAGKALDILYKIAKAGIKINCQIVLCPGINDGYELEKTLLDLEGLGDSVGSVAVVPVGLTKYRKGLFPLKTYDKEKATNVIKIIEKFGDNHLLKFGTRMVYPADEFYLKAGLNIREKEFYGDFSQIENGVGMAALLKSEFFKALSDVDTSTNICRELTVATGTAAEHILGGLCKAAEKKFKGLRVKTVSIKNYFFGETIDVSGLITGSDLISQLSGKALGKELLISSSMLRQQGDIFLDGVSLSDVSNRLGIPVIPVENDGYELLHKMLGCEGE